MTSYELFSLASDLRQQAAACEQVRIEVDLIWPDLEFMLDGALARHGPQTWQSGAADASRLRLHHQRAHLVRLRYQIEHVARRLQDRADELYSDASLVEMAAEAARRAEIEEFGVYINYIK